jgi:hypothetical protein
MKNTKYIFLLVLLAAGNMSFYKPQHIQRVDLCNLANDAFAGGENLVYKVYYNLGFVWIPAGEVTFKAKENQEHYEFIAEGKTYKNYESIFKVNDYFYTKVDKKSMLPQNFVRIVEEGNYRVYDSIRFHHDVNKAMIFHGPSKSKTKISTLQTQGCTQDLMSNLYMLRNAETDEFKKGDAIETKMIFDKEIHPIRITYSGKERKEIKRFGKFNTLKFHPEVVAGNVFKEGDQMTVWVSDDNNRLPLMIESPVSVGSVKVVLKNYKGLRHELLSKI